jgi:nitrogenase delta subunit
MAVSFPCLGQREAKRGDKPCNYCEEPVELETPADRCYWVDAVFLAKGFKSTYPWLATMEKKDIKLLMQGLKERIDYLTITGSLNKELTNPLY